MYFPRSLKFFFLLMICDSYHSAQADSKVFANKRLCDVQQKICIRASLFFDDEKQRLLLQGRVLKSTSAGILELKVSGVDDQGKRHNIKLKTRLKGRYSELIKISSKKLKKKHRKTHWQYQPIRYR